MTTTAIQVFTEAVERGLKLGSKPPDTLTVEPAERCPKDFVLVLKAHKLCPVETFCRHFF
jgi:hypothetical protein